MADIILRSNLRNIALHAMGLFCVMVLVQKGGANEFTVGGSKGWSVPNPNDLHYNPWAENTRFQIGDSLLFVYPAESDSVLRVTADDYTNCNTDSFIEKFSDGHTVYKFSQSGPFYFISGNKDNCLKNEKMVVTVLADRSNQTSPSSPPPPSNMTTPPPAPAGEESPPPPATGTVEINPTPAPVSEPPPNGASSIFVSFIGCSGALAASSLLLL